MQKLFNADLLDIIPAERGFVYACKETLPDGEEAVAFYNYNQEIDIFEKVPVPTYINAKFGENGINIARNLGDFVTCTVIGLSGNGIAVSYPDGRLKVLSESGYITGEGRVEYLGNPACSPASNGADIWFAVPDSHAVINYSIKHERIEFRIGSPKEKAFCHPIDVAVYDNKLFICNAYSYKLRTIDFENYNVTDYFIFHEPVLKYFRVKDIEYVVLQSGVYSLND